VTNLQDWLITFSTFPNLHPLDSDMKTIRGKRALVTGAAAGIGRAIALALAREGADLCLVDINEEGLLDVAKEIGQLGCRTLAIPCDVSQPAQIEAATETLLDTWGGLEILVNNAGVLLYGPTHRMSEDQWERMMAINLLAPIHFIRLLMPTLLGQPESHLVTVSSIYGLYATRKTAAYHAAKFGLVGLTESLRAEYSRQGIGVTTVCPGFVQSNLFDSGETSHKKVEMPQPPAWCCTTAERVATKTIRGIRRNQRLVLVGSVAYGAYYLKSLAPWLLDWIQHMRSSRHTAERLERIKRKKRESAEANLQNAERKNRENQDRLPLRELAARSP
jgi:short-subunit dehydrogenase